MAEGGGCEEGCGSRSPQRLPRPDGLSPVQRVENNPEYRSNRCPDHGPHEKSWPSLSRLQISNDRRLSGHSFAETLHLSANRWVLRLNAQASEDVSRSGTLGTVPYSNERLAPRMKKLPRGTPYLHDANQRTAYIDNFAMYGRRGFNALSNTTQEVEKGGFVHTTNDALTRRQAVIDPNQESPTTRVRKTGNRRTHRIAGETGSLARREPNLELQILTLCLGSQAFDFIR